MADYDLLLQDQVGRLVQDALRLSAHVLARDRTQLPGQLLGRLLSFELPGVRALLEQAKSWKGAPWLHPVRPSLTVPGGPLLRTLTGHTAWVGAVALSADGRRALSGSWDETLKLWDLESGQVMATFSAEGALLSCALAPEGMTIVAGGAIGRVHFLRLEGLNDGSPA